MYPDKPNNTKQKAIATFAVIIIAGIIIAAAFNGNKNTTKTATTSAGQASQQSSTSSTPTDTSSSSTSSNASYKDGTYTASSEYNVPRSFEDIKVTLTVANGVVTDSQIVNSEGDRESAEYQEAFASTYKSQVVGKKLSDIHLSYVAGASDTTDGFNNALEQIKSQAQA